MGRTRQAGWRLKAAAREEARAERGWGRASRGKAGVGVPKGASSLGFGWGSERTGARREFPMAAARGEGALESGAGERGIGREFMGNPKSE